MILPRLQQIYEWSADVLDEPGLRDCAHDGAMIYAWPFEQRGVWRTRKTFAVRMARRFLPPEPAPVTTSPSAHPPVDQVTE